MIQVTFAYLMPDQPAHGTGFHLDGEYAGYIGQDANGDHFVYFYRPFWHNTRIREARGYVMVTGTTGALSLVRRLVARLAYRQLTSTARAALKFDCQSIWFRRVLTDRDLQRTLFSVYVDQRTWNDPSRANAKSDHAFTPECASQKEGTPSPSIKAVAHVYPALSYNLIHYTDGSTRRVTAQDIQAGAEPAPATPAFPLARAACPVSLIPQASTPTRALFLPEAITRSLLNAHRSNAATTTTRNTQ
ncbi:hypothetical protein [Salinicola salarius]|uniref:hypothetical protein n=1 Tax=Salinicola salarius TaxID=430457 RepID=UPI000DA118C3|nr:hypothetical protein [Salinicola salarius]